MNLKKNGIIFSLRRDIVKVWKIGLSLVAVVLIALVVRLPIATTPGFFIGGSAS